MMLAGPAWEMGFPRLETLYTLSIVVLRTVCRATVVRVVVRFSGCQGK